MSGICNDILIEILVFCTSTSILINFSLINKKSFNSFINNKNYIGIKKLQNLLLRTNYNNKLDYLDIYNKIIKYSCINNALRLCAEEGHLKVVEYLIEVGADIHTGYDHALRFSSENGYLEIVKYLVENGANNFNEALKWSARNGHLDVVKYLVEVDANDFDEALIFSARNGKFKIVKYFIELGVDIHFVSDILIESAIRFHNINIVKYLIDNCININIRQVISNCIFFNDLIILKFFIEKYNIELNSDILNNIVPWSNYYNICYNNDNTIVEYLLINGANIFIENNYIFTFCSENIHLIYIKYIVKNCNVNSSVLEKILDWSNKYGHLSVVKFLINNSLIL